MADRPLDPPFVAHHETLPHECFFKHHIVGILIAISWIICLWELYLTFRQRKLMQKLAEPPAVLDGLLSAEVYKKSRSYALDKSTFGIVHDVYSNILNTLFMAYWGLYFSWKWGEDFIEYIGLDRNSEIYVTAGCTIVMSVYSTLICDLPFSIYATFVLEQKHNFNNQTVLFYIKDQITKFIVSLVLMVPLICGMVWIVKNGGDFFYVHLWLFTVAMSLLMMVLYPEVIAPLFDKYSPLPEGELRKCIEALASSLGFPLYKLYIVEGSRRSSHSNAYLYGFYKYKRIVLFDTLVAEYQKKDDKNEDKESEAETKTDADDDATNTIENTNDENQKVEATKKEEESRGCGTDEIIAVLAHELGHWHHSHTLKGYILMQVILLCDFIIFARLMHYTPLFEAFGFDTSKPVLVGLTLILMYVLAPVNKLLSYVMTVLTRRFEFQADAYACKLGHGEALGQALVKLNKDNLSFPVFDWLYSNWHHDHPPLLERLDAIKKFD